MTLNHWDLPQALEDRYGGWRGEGNRVRVREICGDRRSAFGDRVVSGRPDNEPWNNSFSGYGSGAFAPGGTSHADALKAAPPEPLSRAGRPGASADDQQTGCADLGGAEHLPDPTPHARGSEAARLFDAVANRVFTGPMLRGEYASDLLDDTRGSPTGASSCRATSISVINRSTFSALTTTRSCMCEISTGRSTPRRRAARLPGCGEGRRSSGGKALSGPNGLGIEPQGLEDHLVALSSEFPGLPIMVMENGAAFPDTVTGPGATGGHRPNRTSSSSTTSERRFAPGNVAPTWWGTRVVAVGQLRMGSRVRAKVRHRPRRLHTLQRIPKLKFDWFGSSARRAPSVTGPLIFCNIRHAAHDAAVKSICHPRQRRQAGIRRDR